MRRRRGELPFAVRDATGSSKQSDNLNLFRSTGKNFSRISILCSISDCEGQSYRGSRPALPILTVGFEKMVKSIAQELVFIPPHFPPSVDFSLLTIDVQKPPHTTLLSSSDTNHRSNGTRQRRSSGNCFPQPNPSQPSRIFPPHDR